MFPDTTPILPIEATPPDVGRNAGDFAGPDQLSRDALRDTTGPAPEYGPSYAASAPTSAPPAPVPPFDPLTVVKDRPWLSLGLAAAAGVGAGLMLFYRPKSKGAAGGVQPMMGQPAAAKGEHGPSLFDNIVGGIGAELMAAGKHVVDELSGALKEKVHDAAANVQGLIGQVAGGAERPAV